MIEFRIRPSFPQRKNARSSSFVSLVKASGVFELVGALMCLTVIPAGLVGIMSVF